MCRLGLIIRAHETNGVVRRLAFMRVTVQQSNAPKSRRTVYKSVYRLILDSDSPQLDGLGSRVAKLAGPEYVSTAVDSCDAIDRQMDLAFSSS